MSIPARVLLTTDGSEEAGLAARTAVDLAEKTGSELHVVYVGELPVVYHPERHGYRALIEEHRVAARRQLEEQVERVAAIGGSVAQAHLEMGQIGRPDEGIVAVADKIGAGLIVMGSRGLGGLKRVLLGSVSESVVRHAHCPVMVVRGERPVGEEGVFPTRVLVAVDGSEEAAHAAEVALELADETGSELHVVHVGVEYYLLVHDYVSPSQYEEIKADHRGVLDEQVEVIENKGGTVAGAHLRMGNKVDVEVVGLAEELEAGLVVVGSRGLGRMGRSLLGSASESIVRHAHCPVLVVRKEEREGYGTDG